VIYICLPVHDEAQTVGVLLWKIRNVMAEFGRDYEVLVLDDGSTDDTGETLDRYGSSVPLTVLRPGTRLGYAASVERLLREVVRRAAYPKRDAAVVLQGDFTEDPADIVALIKTLEGGADIVAGQEVVDGGAPPRRVRWTRALARLVLGKALRGAPVSDPLCGFRAYRVIVLKKALREGAEPMATASERWAANLELLGALVPHARRLEEAPLSLRYGLQTRPSRFKALRTLRDLRRVGRSPLLWTGAPGSAS
jgi:glycosyltransferase involved in cell wall biosynthesis